MIRRAIAAIALGGSATAAAAATPCQVSIVRAPDGVREVIERWVRGEPRCTGTLEVRIVETADGLYVVANDGAHRTFDRVVPDAESAGALVASWAAAEAALPRLIVTTTIEPDLPDERVAVTVADGDLEEPRPRTSTRRRWGRELLLGAGYTLEQGGTYARLEVDVLREGHWSVGIAGHVYRADGFVEVTATSGTVYGAWASRPGRWRLRGLIAGGLGYVDLRVPGYGFSQQTLNPILEASVLVTRQVTPRWALSAGPLVRYVQPADAMPAVYEGDVGGFVAAHVSL